MVAISRRQQDHAVQFVVGVDMGAAVGLIDLAVGAVLGAGVFGLIRLVGILGLVDVFAAVEAGGHIAAGVDDGAVLVLGLARRHLTVAVAVALDSGVILASPAWRFRSHSVGNEIHKQKGQQPVFLNGKPAAGSSDLERRVFTLGIHQRYHSIFIGIGYRFCRFHQQPKD